VQLVDEYLHQSFEYTDKPTPAEGFIAIGVVMISSIFPTSFHFYNIFRMRKEKQYAATFCFFNLILSSLHREVDPATRIKVSWYLAVVCMHFVAVGHYLLNIDTSLPNPSNPTILAVARAAGFIAAIDSCFVVLALISPIVRFLVRYHNIRSWHQLNFHKSMAWCTCIFTIIHIGLLFISTYWHKISASPVKEVSVLKPSGRVFFNIDY
jgi:hypothetical protein